MWTIALLASKPNGKIQPMTSEIRRWHTSVSQKIPASVRGGTIAVLPLFPGLFAFSVAFAISSTASGVSSIETLALSMLVFAGSAQVATVSLLADGASAPAIVATALLLNLRHVLYGLSASRWFDGESGRVRALFAFVFTDELYAITLGSRRHGHISSRFALSAGWSIYIWFVASTVAGLVLGGRLPALDDLGLDVVFPLAFIALLVPLLRARKHLIAVLAAGLLTLALSRILPSGAVILIVTVGVALAGALIETRWERKRR